MQEPHDVLSREKSRAAKSGKLTFGNYLVRDDAHVGFDVIDNMDNLPEQVEGKSVVILDDIICYGGTFKLAASEFKKYGASEVVLVVNHADGDMVKNEYLFDKEDMKKNGIDKIVILNGLHNVEEFNL